jgi:hypothetical protein
LFDNEIFQNIDKINKEIIELFSNSNDLYEEKSIFNENLRKLNIELRKNIKILSNLTNVEIEPNILTNLIDSLLDNGVMFAICPGGMLNIRLKIIS